MQLFVAVWNFSTGKAGAGEKINSKPLNFRGYLEARDKLVLSFLEEREPGSIYFTPRNDYGNTPLTTS